MAKCKECDRSYGIFELKNGFCKSCFNLKTPDCKGCKKSFNINDLNIGFCEKCYLIEQSRIEQIESENDRLKKLKEVENLTEHQMKDIILTTETHSNLEILQRIDIITAECVIGINAFKDLFTGVRDVIGGRSESTQKTLRDARKTVLYELRKEAYCAGANAVVGVDLDYSEFSGGGKSMLFIVASGTAVKIRKNG